MYDIIFILAAIGLICGIVTDRITYSLPKSDWECTAYDVRPKHGECVEYHVKEMER